MTYELLTTPSYQADLVSAPRSAQGKIIRAAKVIQSEPYTGGGKAKKIFKHKYSNVYRYRAGEYRIVYCLGDKCLKFLMADIRSRVYERLKTGDVPEISFSSQTTKPVPILTTHFDPPKEIEPFEHEDKATQKSPKKSADNGKSKKLFMGLLSEWGVPEEYQQLVLKCSSVEEILDLEIDDKIKERIFHWEHPTNIDEIIEEPVYELPSAEHLEDFAKGTLKGFLLKMDPEQKKVSRKHLNGPTLVKGGPGTGKSLVALYRIRNLMQPDVQKNIFNDSPPRTLFVTYTTTLINASRQLLAPLLGKTQKHVDVKNLDKIVKNIVVRSGQDFSPASDKNRSEALIDAIELLKCEQGSAWPIVQKLLSRVTNDYMISEFDWVIEGRQILTLKGYMEEDRSGRGIPFDKQTREAVWVLHQKYTRKLEKMERKSWDRLRSLALELVITGEVDMEKYDVVIIDEAQDLTPVGLRLCFFLCKDPKGFYMTADSGQSIYNRGFSWKKIHKDMNLRGRSTILKFNYRSTRQIMEAATQPLRDGGGGDPETFNTIPVREGSKPEVIPCSSIEEHVKGIERFLKTAAEEIRLPIHAGCVLARSNKTGEQIAAGLRDRGMSAQLVKGAAFDLEKKVVKVMTIHSAKGLEFPFVAVVRIDKDQMPLMMWSVTDPEEKEARIMDERRLLNVAFSRAMRRLAVTYTKTKPSMFISEMDKSLWTLWNSPF
jgi:superfamily I DNA/RNA helicase/mRNA-degrading endonuclease RelE of RelBE toxin-antitoxin system